MKPCNPFFLTLGLFLFACGCGQNIRHAYIRDGVLRNYTVGEIGFVDSEITTHVNSQEYPTCKAGIGHMPGGEETALCQREVRDNARRRREIRDWQTGPYYYSPYYMGGHVGPPLQ